MNWLQAAQVGIDAEKRRNEEANRKRREKAWLVSEYGKLGFIIFYLRSYVSSLNLMESFPNDMIVVILKDHIFKDDHQRLHYYFFPKWGKMIRSPFRFHLERCSPYQNRHQRPLIPMHDLSLHDYELIIQKRYISLMTRSTSRDSRDFRLDLDLSLAPQGIYVSSFEDFLEGVNSFDKFQSRLLEVWNVPLETLNGWNPYTSDLPDIFDPRPLSADEHGQLVRGFYKMHQFWEVIYTIRGMIYLPEFIPLRWTS